MKAYLSLAVVLMFSFFLSCSHPGVVWKEDRTAGFQQAAQQQKAVVMSFTADWCPWCHKLHDRVFADPRVVEKMKSFVPVANDVTNTTDWIKQLKRKYDINGIPAVVIFDPNGKKMRMLQHDDMATPELLMKVLDSILEELNNCGKTVLKSSKKPS